MDASGKERKIHYLCGATGLSALYVIDNGKDSLFTAVTDRQNSLTAVMANAGKKVERFAYDPWGLLRNPADWTINVVKGRSTRFGRSYCMHEHIHELGVIDMGGRIYDAHTHQFLTPDPYMQAPDSWLNYNRYGYCMQNPMLYTDPSGEFVWAAVIIGAVVGAYMGGALANDGQMNPTKWNYNAGQTWGYMAGGAVVGAISGAVGGCVAASGMPFANTAGIAVGSFVNSVGTTLYTEGKYSNVSISFGACSYNFLNNEFGYIWKSGNSTMENIGYGFGAMANLSDFVALFGGGTSVDLIVEKKDAISHSALVNESDGINISVGPYKELGEGIDIDALKSGGNTFKELLRKMRGKVWQNHAKDGKGWKLSINNVNKSILAKISNNLQTSMDNQTLMWGVLGKSCVSYTSKALWAVGVPNLGGLHPYWLQIQMITRQTGIYSSPYLCQLK